MKSEELWNKFVLSGNIKDYIKFSNKRKEEQGELPNKNSYGCFGDKGNEYR